jgi:outer membrane protein assembly factor BamB
MRTRLPLALALLLCGLPAVGRGDEWPQFRGPGGTGLSREKQLPIEWGGDKNVHWTAKVAGRGWSSPVVWGDKVFLTAAFSDKDTRPRRGGFDGPPTGRPGGPPFGRPAPLEVGTVLSPAVRAELGLTKAQEEEIAKLEKDVKSQLDKLLTAEQKKKIADLGRQGAGGFPPGGFGGGFGGARTPPNAVYRFEVYCLDRATGKVLWKQLALESKPRIPTHGSNTYATETPATDGQRIYAYFGMHGLFCFDLAGKLLWKKDLGAYPMQMGWGTASSPVLDEARVFVQVDNEEKSFLVALDKKNGDEVWRVSRSERTNWGSPIIWKNKQRTELVAPGSAKVRSYDPATGKVLWELSLGGGRCSASPVGDEERLYVGLGGGPGAFGGGGPGRAGGRGFGGGSSSLFAVNAGASGDITPKQGQSTSAGVTWSQTKTGPEMASPLVYQGYLYLLSRDGGLVSCFDAKTGKQAYRERLPGARAFWASPWAYDGKVFCLDDGGTTHVLQAGPEFKVLGKNSLNDQFWATPAVAGGSLILRGVDNVYCIKP